MEAIKYMGVIRLGIAYPAAGLFLKLLLFLMPSFSAKRAAHFSFMREKVQKRLDRITDRKDFLTYASFTTP